MEKEKLKLWIRIWIHQYKWLKKQIDSEYEALCELRDQIQEAEESL